MILKNYIADRVHELANYIIERQLPLRVVAKRFGLSESTVRNDIKKRLPSLYPDLYVDVQNVLSSMKFIKLK